MALAHFVNKAFGLWMECHSLDHVFECLLSNSRIVYEAPALSVVGRCGTQSFISHFGSTNVQTLYKVDKVEFYRYLVDVE